MLFILNMSLAHDTHNTHDTPGRISHDIDYANNPTDLWLLRCIIIAAILCWVAIVVFLVYREQQVHDNLDSRYRQKLYTDPGKAIRFQNIDDEEKGVTPYKVSLDTTNFI